MTTGPPSRRGLGSGPRRGLGSGPRREPQLPAPLGLDLSEAIDVRDELWNIDMRLRELIARLDGRPHRRDVTGLLTTIAKVRLELDKAQTALRMQER